MIGSLDYYRASFLAAHSICMDSFCDCPPPPPPPNTHVHPCFVNLIKAAIKAALYLFGPYSAL